MHPALAQEWSTLVESFPGIGHEDGPERLIVDMPLPTGTYNQPFTRVGVLVPVGYRSTGPDGFLIPVGLHLINGQQLPVSDAAGVGMPGWWMVSFHMLDANGQSTWKPTADPNRGDNMSSYLSEISHFLARSCN
jgi:hypothetical protein